MTNTNVTNFRKNIFEMTESCIKYNDVINVNTKSGNVVILSEEEYNGIMETLYLCSMPGMKESILEGGTTPSEELEELNINEL